MTHKNPKHDARRLGKLSQPERLIVEALGRWSVHGPALFAKEALGANPTHQQEEASRLLVERRRVSIRSGHGTGKSAFLAWTLLWGLICHADGVKIPCTAPTSHQLRDVLWAEVSRWARVLRERVPAIGREIELISDEVRLTSRPQEVFAVARTARPEAPEALQGFHAPTLIFLLDEASGIPDQVYEVAEGALSTPGAYVVLVGNPTRQSGAFYDSHHKDRADWAALHWSGEESPLVSQEYLERMRRRYGQDSPIYRIRVLGEFSGSPDGVIPLDWMESAVLRDVVDDSDDRRWGVDVARFGEDRSVLAVRHGRIVPSPPVEWSGLDTMQVAGRVKQAWDACPVEERPHTIYVDAIGIGAGVVDRLAEMRLPVIGINVAESPADRQDYERLRDELWFRGRQWFEGRDVRLPEGCDDLIAELATVGYSVTSRGKQRVDDKETMRRKGVVHSPDQADAFLLTFADRRHVGAVATPYRPVYTGEFSWM